MVGLRSLPKVKFNPYTSATYVDFTGGLDFARTVNMADPKFVTDALNVVYRHDGGFGSRRAVKYYNNGVNDYPTTTPRTLGWWGWADYGYSYIGIGMQDGSFWTCSGDGVACNLGVAAGPGGPLRMVEVNSFPYLLGDGIAPILPTLDGTRNTALTQNWNPEAAFSELTPTSGDMPMGRLGAVYHGRMWLADITELGTKYKNRVRWSYPILGTGRGAGQESWKQAYYADLDQGVDGETITALVPAGTTLFVMKQHSTYQITGFDVTDVTFSPVNRSYGACNPDAVASLDGTVYMWDDQVGLVGLTRAPIGGNTPMFETTLLSPQLLPLLDSGDIPNERSDEVRVGAHVGRNGAEVWVTVPWGDGRTTFMYDVAIKAWTRFDLDLGGFLQTKPTLPGERSEFVAINRGGGNGAWLLKLDQDGAVDDFGDGPVGFESYCTTARLHANTPFAPKRHDLLRAVVSGTGTMNVEATKDWGDAVISSSAITLSDSVDAFVLNSSALVEPMMEKITPTSAATEEPCSHPVGDSLVGNAYVGLEAEVQLPKTTARAMMLTFRGSPANEWAVHALSLFYWLESGVP